MKLRFVFAFVFVGLLAFLVHLIIFAHTIIPIYSFSNNLLNTIFIISFSFVTIAPFSLSLLTLKIRQYVEGLLYVWFGFLMLVLLSILLFFPLQIILSFFDIDPIFTTYCVLVVGPTLTLYSLYECRRGPLVKRAHIPVPSQFYQDFKNLRLIQLSDIHVSGMIREKYVKKIVSSANLLNPDIIVITGDLFDGPLSQLKEVTLGLKALKANLGIFFITGNHEFYYNIEEWKDFIKTELNWIILDNESSPVKHNGSYLNIIGIEDRSKAKHNDKAHRIELAVSNLEKESYNILLAHQPADAHELKKFPQIHLQLSGHTHGGQIWPVSIFIKSLFGYVKGLYKLENPNQYLYVNQGTGFWGPPMRLGTQNEITSFYFVLSPDTESSLKNED